MERFEVAVRALIRHETQLHQLAGCIVDEDRQCAGVTALLEPAVVAAIDLNQFAVTLTPQLRSPVSSSAFMLGVVLKTAICLPVVPSYAVSLRGTIPASVRQEAGRLDPRSIDTVRSECWPDLRDEHELHDLLMSVVALPEFLLATNPTRNWFELYRRLTCTGRAQTFDCGGKPCWVATEQLLLADALWPSSTGTITPFDKEDSEEMRAGMATAYWANDRQ